MRYAVVRPDGTYEFYEAEGRLDSGDLQRHVAAPNEDEAFIETLAGRDVTLFVNEWGKERGLPVNDTVTEYAQENNLLRFSDDIHGNCVVAGPPDADGYYEQDVDEKILEDIAAYR